MFVIILVISVVIALIAVGIYMLTPAGRMLGGVAPPPEPEEQRAKKRRPRRNQRSRNGKPS